MMHNKNIKTPIHVVMTPCRNEVWILKAFLDTTSVWADYIIIADQMSTDGSREIAQSYPKVILIDNNNPDFNEAERQSMLIEKAREVANGRDCLLWGLDADEILSANYKDTEDWQKIIQSKPGDVFWFKWAEICSDKRTYWDSTFFPWLFHDDGKTPHSNYVRKMHSMRIPYPIEEKQMFYVDDFRVLHFGPTNNNRCKSKQHFYQFVDWEDNHTNPVSLSRLYKSSTKPQTKYPLNEKWIWPDLFININTDEKIGWMEEYVATRIKGAVNDSTIQLNWLDIWSDKEFLASYSIEDTRTFFQKLFHQYLSITKRASKFLPIRVIDKVLKNLWKRYNHTS